MVELGALLGAIIFTNVMLVTPVRTSDLRSFVGAIFVAPIAGGVWGACVGAIIVYVDNVATTFLRSAVALF